MLAIKVHPVILSGGSGSRLWPLSRATMPKQFLPLFSDESMFVTTLNRVNEPDFFSKPIIVSNKDHRFLITEQLKQAELEANALILEPCAKNTAPAIALAAFHILEHASDSLMLVMPSDHVIRDVDKFHSAVEAAYEACQHGKLVTFGIEPTCPETGYGYIQSGNQLFEETHSNLFDLTRFVEKPNKETAEAMLQEGGYHWNSGIFLFSALQYLNELSETHPEMVYLAQQAYNHARRDDTIIEPYHEFFNQCESDSIDYAVMEHTDNAAVVKTDFYWSDAGSWLNVWQEQEKDEDNNVVLGDVITDDTQNCYIRSNKKLVTTVGVEDLIIVDTEDALLVADKSKSQDVKKIVEGLDEQARPESKLAHTVNRPWGTYKSIDQGTRHQVKHITVEPGSSLSLQYHHHRSEHWIVVEGVAEVQVGDQHLLVGTNESVYIEKEEVHRLTNNGDKTLHLIEVQCGNYLGEDDIVRLEDNYGRVNNKVKLPGTIDWISAAA